MNKRKTITPNRFQALRRVQARVANSAQSLAENLKELSLYASDGDERRRILDLSQTFSTMACDVRAHNLDLAALNFEVFH